MSTELSNGVIIPEEYSDDWYDEMSINLRKLNDVITAASDNATDIQRLDTDKANQSDLTALTSRVYQNETDIIALQTAVSGALKREIVQTLPTEDISTTTIYMIRNTTTSGDNIYDEYMYINNLWELIGTSATDFSNYYTKTEIDTLLSYKATDSNVMHLSGNETADGLKTFIKYITSDGSSTGDEYSSNTRTNLWLMGNRDTEEVSGVLFDSYRQNIAQGIGTHVLGIGIKENSVRYEGCRWGWYWDNNLNGYSFDFKPTTQGANQALKHNLGTSTDKWDTINGINPGALSLPSNSYVNVDTTNWDVARGTNVYTPPANGWLHIRVTGATELMVRWSGWRFGDRRVSATATDLDVTILVVAGVTVDVVTVASGFDGKCLFFPCQGNV